MARRHQEIRARLLATFRAEAEEHLATITAGLARLEGALPASEAAEVVAATFRAVHTLKGAARSVSLLDVEAVCQAMEAVLSRATRGDVALHGPLLAQLQQAADAIGRLLEGRRDAVDVAALTSALERAAGASIAPAGPSGNASAGERAAAADLASGPTQAPSPRRRSNHSRRRPMRRPACLPPTPSASRLSSSMSCSRRSRSCCSRSSPRPSGSPRRARSWPRSPSIAPAGPSMTAPPRRTRRRRFARSRHKRARCSSTSRMTLRRSPERSTRSRTWPAGCACRPSAPRWRRWRAWRASWRASRGKRSR